ncbi:MAG: metal-dependent transcriptional regulator [Firmicutes bacterium]|nr:metal-dependent transcriptional regulator [Bacillota bacterium]
MALHESGEMYLETIYVLTKENPSVRAIDVGEHMGFSKPSVSRGLSLLKESGYVQTDANGYLSLTEAGIAIAEKIFERHTILTTIFTNLGVDEETAAEDACKIEHVISDKTFAALKKHLAENTK